MRVRRAELNGLSQQDAALRAGLTRDRYWRIEKGYTEPTAIECMAIAVALSTTAEQLFPGFGQRFPEHTSEARPR